MTLDELLRSSGLAGTAGRPASPAPPGRKTVHLHAGNMYSSAEPAAITTILGSCVAVCLWDPIARVGGMNHYMLPNDCMGAQSGPRFAAFAVPHLVGDLLGLGATRGRLTARIFGGACILREFQENGADLGLRNVEAARQLLEQERVPVVHEDVGGHHGRKLVFSTADGTFILKSL